MHLHGFVRAALSSIVLSVFWLSGCNQTTTPHPVREADQRAPTRVASAASVAAPPSSANAPAAEQPAPALSAANEEAPAPTPNPITSNAPPTPPPLVDAAGMLLPQTEDKPSLESPLFQYRLSQLVKAIETGDPERARDFFFPKMAYEKVKAIKSPGRDWEARLWKLFQRDIAEYHAKLGENAAGSKLVRLEVNESRIKWMKPQSEGNTLGYHRVTRNKLHLRDGAGNDHVFDITSFISWRGEWYVVHLHGFK
jgi:hypothetical protein